MADREEELGALMRAAVAGDASAYDVLLRALTQSLRPVVRSACARVGTPMADVEDIVQDVLLAVHLKRHTWDPAQRLGPWLRAIVHHKVIDGLRRRGRRDEIPIDDVIEVLPAEREEPPPSRAALDRYTDALGGRQRDVVRAIGSNAIFCAICVPLLSIAPMIGLFYALSRAAPANARLAGFVAGLCAGGIGAAAYAAHCTDDSPLFVAVWYSMGVVLMGAVGALLGSRYLRW